MPHNVGSIGFWIEVSTLPREHMPLLPVPPPVGADSVWALFLDVDGTLLDLAHRPDEVEVDAQLRADLAHLHERLGGALALLSGRPLAQLDALLDWHGHAAAGLHGAELRTPDGRQRIIGDADAFAATRARATELVRSTDGVLLEDKLRALALHYRRAPSARATAERIAETLVGELHGYVLQRGDCVIELKPAGVDKGRALAALLDTLPFHGRCPWMLGDDLTDEDAFARVNQNGGVSVVVGARRPTVARHALADPAAVRAWLHALVTSGGRGAGPRE